MLVIAGRIFIDVQIDKTPLDNSPNAFSTLILTESVAGLFPAAFLTLNDHSGQLNRQLALTESNEVLVTVGRTPNDLNTISRQYRVYQPKQAMTGFGPQIKVSCIYDAPKFISEGANETYMGTSSQVLQQVADKCKLYYCGPEKYNGRTMNDSQRWWNINRSRAAFAQQNVARHGYQDPHSAMCAAVTSMGELRYRNLMDVIETPMDQIPWLFVHSSPTSEEDRKKRVYLVDAAQSHSDAGLMNSWQNYGSTRIVHSRSGVDSIESAVDVKTSGKYLAINDQVAQTVGRARYDHSLLDCGNVNEKYERAFYQNTKQLGLFSERVSVLCSEPTSVQLLDPVIYRQSFSDLSETASTSDVYLVVAKTLYVKGGIYYAERLELVRMSLTEKGESALKCAFTPDKAAQSAIPESQIDPTALSRPGIPGVCAQQLEKAKSIQALSLPADQAAAQAKLSSLKVAKAAVNVARGALQVVALVKGGVAGILSNPLGALTSLTQATGSLLQYNNALGGFQSEYAQAGMQALAYANGRLTDPLFTDAIRIASFVRPGGLAENQAAITGALYLNDTTREIFRASQSVLSVGSSIASLRDQPGGRQALDGFNYQLDVLEQSSRSINKGFVDMWNGGMCLTSGKSIPIGTLTRDNSSSLRAFVNGSLAQPTHYEAKVLSPSDVKSSLTKAITVTNDDRSLRWGDSSSYEAFRPVMSLAEIEEAASSLDTLAKRYQSQQAMSYI